ncbi:prestin-like [Argopecten irradians]|uniref:prestin-like n=1 Tax=Argopecten irradians TaxID=31199 RepID=UPI003718E4A9
MDPNVRATLLEMNRKRGKFRTEALKRSQERVRKELSGKLKLKKVWKSVNSAIPNLSCSVKCTSSFLHEVFPFWGIMRKYSLRRFLLSDFLAGLTVAIVHIPQGMAYGLLAELPPVYGLYSSFLPVITYFFFGSSKHISMGTFAVTSLMIGSVVQEGLERYEAMHGGVTTTSNSSAGQGWDIANVTQTTMYNTNASTDSVPILQDSGGNTPESVFSELDQMKIAYAMSATFTVGVFQLLMGVFRLGFLASFLSDPLISGFTTGAAVHVFSSQVHHLFGVKVHPYHGPLRLIYFYRDFFNNIHTVNPVTATASVTCIFVLVLIKEGVNYNPNCQPDLPAPVPIELIVVIASTVISYYTKIHEEFQVDVVGTIPRGLPPASAHDLRYVWETFADGLMMGFVAFTISYAMAKILAEKHDYAVNTNQELVANGMCNFLGSFFSCFCSAASLSRSLVQDNAGGCTQMVGIFSSFVLLIVLLYIGPLFSSLPNCILACIVIVTLKGMFKQFKQMRVLWKLCRRDFAVWLVTFVATVVLDVALGLLVGVIFALYFIVRNSQKPHACILGRVPGTSTYKDVKRNRQVYELPGIKIFRFESSLYFANAEQFRDRLYERTQLNPKKLKGKKQRALYKALLQRKREQELAELEQRSLKSKSKKDKRQKNSIEIEIEDEVPEELTDEHKNLLMEQKNEIVDLFSNAWIPPIHTLVIDCSVIDYVDTSAVKILAQIVNEYKDVGIKVFLAGLREDGRNILKKADFYHEVEYNCLYYTVHEAVVISQEIHAHLVQSDPKYLQMVKREFGDTSSFTNLTTVGECSEEADMTSQV